MAFVDGAAMLDESSDISADEQAYVLGPRRGWGVAARRPGLPVVLAGLGVAGLTALGLLASGGAPTLTKGNARAATGLSASDPCADFPFLDMRGIKRNNLGGKGPVKDGKEGIVFEGVDIDPGHQDEEVDLHINALTPFEPAWVSGNMLGFANHAKEGNPNHFMRVNLKPGHEVTLKISAMKPGTTEPKSLRKATFTFFDLDTHGSGQNKEYVQAEGSSATITYDGTELVETDKDEDAKRFTASTPGTGKDNPTDPLSLTEQQLQRAVTFIYEPFTEAVVTLGSSGGANHGRVFDFVGRPSLQCATGVEPEKVVIVESTPQEVPTCCLVKVPMLFDFYCVPEEEKKFYHFMC